MSAPLISVIIPVYNGERYLAAALESAITQTWKPLEIIVVDDGSTDTSAAVAREFLPSIRHALRPHEGPGAARNHGVGLARGDYFAFLDADDLWAPNKLAWQMSAFAAQPELDAVFGHVEQFLSPDLPAERAEKIDCPAGAAPARLPGTLLIKRQAFEKVGWFATKLRIGEFIEWYARAMQLAVADTIVPQTLLRRRIHATNTGLLQRDARSDYARIVKAAIDRRRQRAIKEGPS